MTAMTTVDVDFNMYDDGDCGPHWIAVTDEPLTIDDPFIATDVEGHVTLAVVVCLRPGGVGFVDVNLEPIPVATTSGIRIVGCDFA